MKQTLLQLFFLLFCLSANAQTTTYKSGFDNAAEKAGWVTYRKGFISPYDWVMGPSSNATTPPNVAFHDYAVGGATSKVVDWLVSPALYFTSGGKIDSVDVLVYAIMGSTDADDHFGIYLLSGSPDPATATVTSLQDLTSNVTNGSTFTTIKNITIPATTGPCYIGFKCTSKDNWFTPYFDDLHITGSGSAPCSAPASVTVSNITGSGATLTWPAVTGAIGYEYAATASATPPASGTPVTSPTTPVSGLSATTAYYAHVRTKCGSSYSGWTSKTFTTTTGITNITRQSGILVYPNPAAERVTVSGISKGAELTVTDLSGKLLLHDVATDDVADITVACLQSGIYLIHISGTGYKATAKFCKE